MLLFAFWVSRDTADIMEIHTPFHTWFRSFFRLMLSRIGTQNAVMTIQDLPDRARGTRQNDACLCEVLILIQIVQDRERPRCSS